MQNALSAGDLPNGYDEEIRSIRIQRFVNRCLILLTGVVIIGYLKYVKRYRIPNLRKIRAQYKVMASEKRPILICPNHLTMIDSLILHWAFGSLIDYLLQFRLMSWNVPAVEHFKTKPTWRLVTYLGKCIPIDRFGTKEHLELVLEKMKYLLRNNEIFTVFPEGRRSRTGRFDIEGMTYGVGKLVQDVENCKVILVYLRGHTQKDYTVMPASGDVFYIDMESYVPGEIPQGLRGQKQIATAIAERLQAMEARYFGLKSAAGE